MKPTTTDILPQGYKMTELGPLPEEWEVVQLANKYIEFQNGLWKGKKEPYINVRVLRNTNFNNDGTIDFDDVAELDVEQRNFKNREIIKDDIILERSGGGPTQPVGRVVFFEKNDQLRYSFSNFTSRIRVIDKLRIFPKYLFFYLLNFYYQGKTNDIQNRTTGIRNLDFSKYKQISLPLPPLPEQQKIAAVLTAVQEAKEKTQAVIDATKALKKSMMKYLFTYGPVWPEEAANVPLKETEIGKVPEDWEVVRLREVTEKAKQKDPRRDPSNEFKYVDVSAISNDALKITSYSEFLGKNAPHRARKAIQTDDIIFATVRPYLKRIAIVPENLNGQIASTAFCVIRCKKQIVNPYYIFYTVSLDNFVNRVTENQRGSSYPAVTDKDILNQYIPLPPLPIQQKIASILSAIDAKIEAEENKKQALEELFKTLLHNLMTAKIRVTGINELP